MIQLTHKRLEMLDFMNSNPESYGSKVAYKLNMTYSHCHEIINEFEQYGLLKTTYSGRIRAYKITKHGKTVAHLAYQLLNQIQKGKKK